LIERTNHEWPDPLAPLPPRQAGTSQLLRVSPPARPASVLDPSRFQPLGTLPLAHSSQSGQYRDAPSPVPCGSSL